MRERRATTLQERLTPCECCGHPLSHRHHQLPIEWYHENDQVVYLCPNCHEMFHVLERAWSDWQKDPDKMTNNRHLAGALLRHFGDNDPRLDKLYSLISQQAQLMAENRPHKAFEKVLFGRGGLFRGKGASRA